MIRSLLASALSRAHVVASAVDDAIVCAWMALTGSPPLTRETLAQALGVRVVEDAPACSCPEVATMGRERCAFCGRPVVVHFRISRYVPAYCGDVDGPSWSSVASFVVGAGSTACPTCKAAAAEHLARRRAAS